MALAPVKDIDHLVLTCGDVAATVSWYETHLSMTSETFTSEATPEIRRTALKFGTHKINLHQRGKEFEPKAATALPGTADLCFLISDDVSLENVCAGFSSGWYKCARRRQGGE